MKYLSLFILLFVPALAKGQFLFQDATIPSGVFMQTTNTDDVGPGVVVFDLDGDGWDDFYLAGGLDSDKLFLNMHDGTFKNVATPSFAIHDLAKAVYPHGGSAFDYDNDGFPDLYICCEGRDILWHNNGDGTFTDKTRDANLNFPLDQNESNGSSFGDFNGDGFNDIYVARWIHESRFKIDTASNTATGYAHRGFPNWLYLNNGNGTFTEVAAPLGVTGDTGTSNIALFFDYDRDGDLDLFVGNDFGVQLTPNQVFKNMLMETGVATFVDVSKEIGLDCHLFNMGIGPNDFNRDGNFDFFETSIGEETFMKNKGDNTYSNAISKVLESADLRPGTPGANGYERHGTYMTTTWTALFGDFDNDGWEDGMIVHGFEGSLFPWVTNLNQLDTSVFLHNIGSFFEDYTDKALVDRFGNQAYFDFRGRGAASLDYNHDGKLDIVMSSLGPGLFGQKLDARLLKNITPAGDNPKHWLEMRFSAVRTAKEGIGTIVDVWAGGIVHSRQVSTGGGFGCQSSLMQHVGLGDYTKADSIIVYWPCDKHRNRTINKYYDVAADQMIHYTEDTTRGNAGVAPPVLKEDIKIYPSPVSSVLHVQNSDASLLKHYEVYDLLGIREMDINGTENSFSFSVKSLKPGCYTLRITYGGNVVTKQFIKN